MSAWRTAGRWLVLTAATTVVLSQTGSQTITRGGAAASNIKKPENITQDGALFQNVYALEAKGDFAAVERKDYYDISYFCHAGMEASLPRFWSSVSFNLDIENSDYSVRLAAGV